MGKSVSSIIVPGARMTADDNAKLALQAFLAADLRAASRKRHERGALVSAAFAGVIVATLALAANWVFPFLPS